MGGRPRDPSAEELGSFRISCFSFRSSVPVAGGRAEEVAGMKWLAGSVSVVSFMLALTTAIKGDTALTMIYLFASYVNFKLVEDV